MCERCEPWLTTKPIPSRMVYDHIVERVRVALTDGELELFEASIPLDAIIPGATLPAYRKHLFACTMCSQLFILEVGGCHTVGDCWRPLHGN